MIRRLIAAGAIVATMVAAPSARGAPFGADCASAAGAISVPVIIDFGELRGDTAPVVTCVSVADGASGTAALNERARRLGTPAPRFNAAGFLCAVDGTPASGCGDDAGSTVAYWSYWWASTTNPTWRYATRGSDQRRLSAGVIEGWRYIVGTAAQGPGLAPRRDPGSVACAAAAPPAVPPAAPVPAPPPAAADPRTTTPGAPGPADPGPVAAAPIGGDTAPPNPDLTSTTLVDPVTTTAISAPTTSSPSEDDDRVEVANDPLSTTSDVAGGGDDGGDGWAGPVAGAFVVVAAGALATVQARRRRLRS